MSKKEDELHELPAWKKKIINSKYLGRQFFWNGLSQHDVADIDERLRELEERVFKTARKTDTTRSQQMLLMRDLGLLDKLNEFKLSNHKKAKLLSILLNASPDNIEGDLSSIHRKDYKHINVLNYEFLLKTYNTVGLKELSESTDITLDELKSEK
jgi:hypothetical protein